MKTHPSSNFNERKYPVSMIVLHYTAIPTCEEALARLCDTTNESGRVSVIPSSSASAREGEWRLMLEKLETI